MSHLEDKHTNEIKSFQERSSKFLLATTLLLEMFLMLRVNNKHMWSEQALQNIIDKKKSASVGAAIARSKHRRDDEAIPLTAGGNSN